MTKKIFHSILLVAGTVLLASLLVIMGCLYEYFGSVEKKQLRDELELAAVAVEKNGTEYLSQLSSERYRLTWIENDGTVLYDTMTDAESLENHADRVEVKQALEYGDGESTRYSSTLLQKTMYCAERLADGKCYNLLCLKKCKIVSQRCRRKAENRESGANPERCSHCVRERPA